jgi:hypothetical protein
LGGLLTVSRHHLSITVGCASTTTRHSYASCSKHVPQRLSYASGCCSLSEFLGRAILRFVLWGVFCWQSKLAATRLSGLKLRVSICGIMAHPPSSYAAPAPPFLMKKTSMSCFPFLSWWTVLLVRADDIQLRTQTNNPAEINSAFSLCLRGSATPRAPAGVLVDTYTSKRMSPNRICFCTG